MERHVPFLADTSGPFKQLLAAEQTAQSVQAWIQEKKDEISTIKRQAIDQDIPFNDIYEHIKLLEYDIGAFKRLLEYNEESRCIWRRAHAAASRATIRPLKVVDMPNEILTRIFANFEDVPVPQTQFDHPSWDGTVPNPEIATIKNIRLTCRAFCQVGSEFLVPILDISFSQPSLRRLDQISSHPAISKSVRLVQFDISPYSCHIHRYDEFLDATYRRFSTLRTAFANQALKTQLEMAETFRMSGDRDGFRASKTNYLDGAENDESAAIENALYTLTYPRRPRNTASLEHVETRVGDAIARAREEYSRRHFEQKSLFDNPKVYADILASIRRMPSAQRICIADLRGRHWYEAFKTGCSKRRLDSHKYSAMIRGPDPFHELMVHPGVNEEAISASDGEPPLSLLCHLPSLFQAVSQNLTHLEIDIQPKPTVHIVIPVEHLESLRQACQQLKSLKLKIVKPQLLLQSQSTTPKCFRMIIALLSAMLGSPLLEELKICLQLRPPDGLNDTTTILGAVLENLSGNTLQGIWLINVPIKTEEIRRLLERVAGKLHLEMKAIHLLDGTWAELLDVLRGKTDSTSRIVYPRGGEMTGMSKEEASYFRKEFRSQHRDGWFSDQRCPGPASFYIRGGNIPNPLI